MNKKKTVPKWHIELHEIIKKFVQQNKVDGLELLAYLSLSMVGTVEGNGFGENFFKTMLDEMMSEFRKNRKARNEDEL